MLMALTRIVELDSGSILIDDQDISRVDLKALRNAITIIPQEPTLFTGTLRFNIDPFNEHSDDRVIQLLKRAGLDHLLNHESLNFKVQEEGKNLSVGERQLLCIIRAILRQSKLVMLDEATANIDVVTEKTIQSLIKEEFEHATVLTIAHRLNTIINSDKVLFLS